MSNFTEQCSDDRIHANEAISVGDEKYNAALKKIGQLECELNQRNRILSIVVESLESCASSFHFVKGQVELFSAYLDNSNQKILELSQENKALKSLSDGCFRRAIKREFELLTLMDELKKIKDERDLALKTIELLQVEQILADKKGAK